MKTFRSADERTGKLFGFEVENAYITASTLVQLLEEVEGVGNVQMRKRFRAWDGTHALLKYFDKTLVVWEPHGDNSRYWVGPRDEEDRIDISPLADRVELYQVPMVRRLLGDVLTLKLLTRLFRER